MKTITLGNELTVIIRDDSPMIHCNDSPSYRSVRIELTEDQVNKIKLRHTATAGGVEYYETISKCFIEERATPTPGAKG